MTGPRVEACPDGCAGLRHFAHAASTLLYHELAIAATAVVVVAASLGAANQLGVWTFAALWAMRLSAKLNVYLGVPNVGEELLPEHLRYLERFFTRRRMNLLFPVSVTAGTLVTSSLVGSVSSADASAFQVTSNALLATMLGLAVLEHWFMVLPLPSTSLWSWGLRSRSEGSRVESTPVAGTDPPRG